MLLCLNCFWSTLFLPALQPVIFTGDFGTPLHDSGHSVMQKIHLPPQVSQIPPPHLICKTNNELFTAQPHLSCRCPGHRTNFSLLRLTPWHTSAKILLCSPTPTRTYHMGCSETRWNMMGENDTTTAVFEPSCSFLAEGRKVLGMSLFPFSKPGPTMLKVSGAKWSQRIFPEGDKGGALHRTSAPSIVHWWEVCCPFYQVKNSFPIFFRIHKKR